MGASTAISDLARSTISIAKVFYWVINIGKLAPMAASAWPPMTSSPLSLWSPTFRLMKPTTGATSKAGKSFETALINDDPATTFLWPFAFAVCFSG
jgi:hypothetical protein